jgi:hypothetical protein
MAKQALDRIQIHALLSEARGKGVPQIVKMEVLNLRF